MQESFPIILVVDHDPLTLELYQRTLGAHFQVKSASDQSKAIQWIASEKLSAVVLEPAGWGDGGLFLLAALKASPINHSVPVILCTSMDERQLVREMGVADYLVKPVLPTTLRQILSHLLHLP